MAVIVIQNNNTNPSIFYGLTGFADAIFLQSDIPLGRNAPDLKPTGDPCNENAFLLPALAEASFTSDLKNDKKLFIYEVPSDSDSLQFDLQKFEVGSWITKETDLQTGAFGVLLEVGDDESAPLFTSYTLNWSEVLDVHGEGKYRMNSNGTFTGGFVEILSDMYCLKTYSDNAANDTVRFDWTISGSFGDINNPGRVIDFGTLNAFDSLRVQGYFGNEKEEQEVEEIEFQNRQIDRTRDLRRRKWEFISGRLPKFVHDKLKFGFQNDTLVVTDYNLNNDNREIEQHPILKDGGYEPDYKVNSILARVTVEFKDKFDNLEHRKC